MKVFHRSIQGKQSGNRKNSHRIRFKWVAVVRDEFEDVTDMYRGTAFARKPRENADRARPAIASQTLS